VQKAQMLIHSAVPPLPHKIIFDAFPETPLCENYGLADGSMKSKLAFVRQPDSIPRKTAFSLRCFAAILLRFPPEIEAHGTPF